MQTMKSTKVKSELSNYLSIVLGSCIVSVGFVLFINPYKFVPGGVFGASIVLHNLFPHLQVGTFSYMISIPLLILSYFFLGKGIGIKTLFATLITPLIMNGLSTLVYPSTEALQAPAPTQLVGGVLALSDRLIVAAIIGPVLVGTGSAFIVGRKATTGGTDIIAMILQKYLRVKFSNALICTDGIIVLLGLLVIGFGIGTGQGPASGSSCILSLYSLLCIFLMTKTLAYVVSGSKNDKIVFIITKKGNEPLRQYILQNIDRTATILSSEGLYSLEPNSTFFMVVPMRQVESITTAIRQFDDNAFVVVTDAYDAYGKRWKAFPDKNTIVIK